MKSPPLTSEILNRVIHHLCEADALLTAKEGHTATSKVAHELIKQAWKLLIHINKGVKIYEESQKS